jgi:type IV pilus assembly protein PilM
MGKILSVFFENDDIRICELEKKGSNVVVRKAFDTPLPANIVEDGLILDPEAAAKTLYAAFKNNKIKRGKIAFVISSRKIANKEIVLPYVKNQKKVEEMVLANIDEYFPMNNLEDYVFKHNILDTFDSDTGKQYSVLVMAVQKQMIEGYYQVANMLKMPVYTVDYYGNAIYQLLKHQLEQQITALTLQMDRNATYVSIMRGKAQLFKRSIPFGRDSVAKNLAEYKELTLAEANQALKDKRKLEIIITPEEYKALIREFTASVTRVVEFHISRNPETTIEQVKLLGAGLDMAGLAETLTEELGLETVPVRELKNVKVKGSKKDKLDYDSLADYLPNIGALFAPLDLKIEEEKKSKNGSYVIFVVLIVLAALAVCGVSIALLYIKDTLEKQKVQLQNQIDSYTTAEATYNAYLTSKNNYDTLSSYYESTKNPTEMLYRMIQDLEMIMPESVGISDISIKDGSVDMTGVSDGKDALAAFVIELKKLSYVTDVRVDDILDTTTELGGKTSTFNISWQLILQDEEGEETEESTEGGAQ